jgi:hypothetical protein
MISTDDRLARLLAERGDACVAIDLVTMITAPYARRASASNDARAGALLDLRLARSMVERAVASRHPPEGERR